MIWAAVCGLQLIDRGEDATEHCHLAVGAAHNRRVISESRGCCKLEDDGEGIVADLAQRKHKQRDSQGAFPYPPADDGDRQR